MQIFHIAVEADWRAAEATGTYTVSTRGVTLEEEGFIHCSKPEQVEAVRRRSYTDVDAPLLLLTIDTDRLVSPWRFDAVPGTGEEFPHVYGPLNLAAVVETQPL